MNGKTEFWRTLTPEICTKYISHLRKVIPKVIAVNGEASCYYTMSQLSLTQEKLE